MNSCYGRKKKKNPAPSSGPFSQTKFLLGSCAIGILSWMCMWWRSWGTCLEAWGGSRSQQGLVMLLPVTHWWGIVLLQLSLGAAVKYRGIEFDRPVVADFTQLNLSTVGFPLFQFHAMNMDCQVTQEELKIMLKVNLLQPKEVS